MINVWTVISVFLYAGLGMAVPPCTRLPAACSAQRGPRSTLWRCCRPWGTTCPSTWPAARSQRCSAAYCTESGLVRCVNQAVSSLNADHPLKDKLQWLCGVVACLPTVWVNCLGVNTQIECLFAYAHPYEIVCPIPLIIDERHVVSHYSHRSKFGLNVVALSLSEVTVTSNLWRKPLEFARKMETGGLTLTGYNSTLWNPVQNLDAFV